MGTFDVSGPLLDDSTFGARNIVAPSLTSINVEVEDSSLEETPVELDI